MRHAVTPRRDRRGLSAVPYGAAAAYRSFATSHGMSCDTVRNFRGGSRGRVDRERERERGRGRERRSVDGDAGRAGQSRPDHADESVHDPVSRPCEFADLGCILQYDLAATDALRAAMVEVNVNVPGDLKTSSIMYWALCRQPARAP